MTRKFLQGLGIESDIIDKIMATNGDDIEREKAVAETLKEEVKNLKLNVSKVQQKFDDYKAQQPDVVAKESEYENKIKELEATNRELEAAGKEELKEALKMKNDAVTNLKTEYDTKIADYETKITQYEADKVNTTKKSMLEQHLLAAGAKPKYVKKIANDFDIDKLEIDGDKFKEFDKALEEVKPSWSDMFGESVIIGADPADPPQSQPQTKYTMEQIKTMTPDQINANWDKGVKQAVENSKK